MFVCLIIVFYKYMCKVKETYGIYTSWKVVGMIAMHALSLIEWLLIIITHSLATFFSVYVHSGHKIDEVIIIIMILLH